MVEILTKYKRELEIKLRERIQALIEANNESPESASIEMKLSGSGEERNLSAIPLYTTIANGPGQIMTANFDLNACLITFNPVRWA